MMIAFVSWVVWNTGKIHSPLLNLYLLPIIASALILGKVMTLIETAAVAACFVALSWGETANPPSSLAYYGELLAQLSPVILVAYITTMLSADIRFAVDKIKRVSDTDELTGVYNMRAFNVILQRTFRQAVRYGHPMSLRHDRLGQPQSDQRQLWARCRQPAVAPPCQPHPGRTAQFRRSGAVWRRRIYRPADRDRARRRGGGGRAYPARGRRRAARPWRELRPQHSQHRRLQLSDRRSRSAVPFWRRRIKPCTGPNRRARTGSSHTRTRKVRYPSTTPVFLPSPDVSPDLPPVSSDGRTTSQSWTE